MRLGIDTNYSELSSGELTIAQKEMPEEQPTTASLPRRREDAGGVSSSSSRRRLNGNGVSPRSPSTGTTFQQYRQQQSVRKHPWRTDVKGRGNNRRGVKSWRNLVKSAAPWDEAPCPIIREEDEEGITRTESKDSGDSAVSCAISMAEDLMKEVSESTENKSHEKKSVDPFLEALRKRVEKVYQGDHYIVQANGTGRGKAPPPAYNVRDQQVRQQLVRALHERLQSVYTGHLVSLEAYGKQGVDVLNEQSDESGEEEEGDSDEGSVVSMDESVVSVQSMIVAATILNSVPTPPAKEQQSQTPHQPARDDDEWTEYTVESRAPSSRAEAMSMAKSSNSNMNRRNFDSDEWTEYTVESHAPKSRAELMSSSKANHSNMARRNFSAHSSSDEWDEYTVQDDPLPQFTRNEEDEEEEWDEETVATEALSRGQRAALESSYPRSPVNQSADNQEWDEYTVETAYVPQQSHSVPIEKEDEWDEYTVESAFPQNTCNSSRVLSSQNTSSRKVVTPDCHQPAVDDNDDDQWDEYTVETIADALLALPRALSSRQLPVPSPEVAHHAIGNRPRSSSSSIVDTVKNIVQDSKSRLAHYEDEDEEEYEEETLYEEETIEEAYDDDHWDDYTVETVADAFASLPRSLQLEFLRTTSTRSVAMHQQAVEADDESDCSSQPPPEGAYPDLEEQEGQQARETIHDIPGILRQADSAKSAGSKPRKSAMGPIVADPTLSSTDSESETWHDARSSGSSDPSIVQEVSSESSTGNNSRSASLSRTRRTRFPPKNLNQVLQEDIFSRDLTIVEGALCNLAQKADDDLEYRAHIVRSGGILAIVRAMQQNVYNSTIQVLACKTLENIATDRENRVAIGEVGGVEAVVGAMAEHMGDEQVAESTCKAVWVLTSGCQSNQLSVEAAALDTVVSCMRRYAKNAIVQEKAFQTLANLCVEDEEKLVALSQMGGFVVMSAALVLHWENPTVKNEAITTLAQLFGRLALYQSA